MRSDFGKVVTERPRSGSSEPNKRTRGRVSCRLENYEDFEDGGWRRPMNIGSNIAHWKKLVGKNRTDLLGPLYRYLGGMVGRPVNEARSELSRTLGNRPEPQQHVLRVHFEYQMRTGPHSYASDRRPGQTDDGLIAYFRYVHKPVVLTPAQVKYRAEEEARWATRKKEIDAAEAKKHRPETCDLCHGLALRLHNRGGSILSEAREAESYDRMIAERRARWDRWVVEDRERRRRNREALKQEALEQEAV